MEVDKASEFKNPKAEISEIDKMDVEINPTEFSELTNSCSYE